MVKENEEFEEFAEYEIDLREYIRVLWDGKWLIIGLFVLAILVAGFYSMFIVESQYEARANLLILPPKYKTSLEVSTLPIETYRSLALTDSIKQKIIDDIELKNDDGEPYVPSDLDNMLDLEVQGVTQEQNERQEETIKAPLIVLKVRGVEPEKLSKIANAWADNFMKDSKKIRKGEIEEVSQVIQRQFEDTKEKLGKARQELKEFKKEARLELAKTELSVKKEKLNRYTNKLLDLKNQLGSEKAKYQHLTKALQQREKEGEWIGELDNKLNQSNNISAVEVKQNYINSQNELLNYLKEHDVNLLHQKIEVKRNNLKSYLQKVSSLKNQLITKRTEIKKIESLLATEPDRWKLKKAITNNALWENILKPEEINAIKNMRLTDEIINPIYKKLKNRLSDNKILVKSIPEQIDYYQKLINTETKQLEKLNYTLKEWRQSIDRLKADVSNYEKIYNQETSTYRRLKDKKLKSQIKLDNLQAQIAFYKETKNSFEKEIKQLQNQVWQDEIMKEKLNQRVKDVKKTYNMLATKVEEARISEAQKTSDVKFIARAIPPTKPIGPNKKIIVAIAGVLALMLGVFIVFFREFMSEEI